MKKRDAVIIITAVCIVIAVLSVIILTKDKKRNTKTVQSETSSTDTESIVIDGVDEDTDDKGKLKDNGTGISPDETEADKILKEAKNKKNKSVNVPVLPAKESKKKTESSSSNTSKAVASVKSGTSSKSSTAKKTKKYVQDANPDTGISWDGKSKIIYRTVNGDTTVKTYGGYYELRPDQWVLLEEPTEKSEYDGKCEYCGRVSGDGTNGTCVRYSLINEDMSCPNCGKTIPAGTCHSCK